MQDCEPCSPLECFVFERVVVNRSYRNGVRVAWELADGFTDPRPHTFQLQYGVAGVTGTGDWLDVGGPVVDSYLAIDDEHRGYESPPLGRYRVQLTTSLGSYLSGTVHEMGTLQQADWRIVREMMRQKRIEARMGWTPGYMLKSRRAGAPCSRCIDRQTDAPTDPDCPNCYGTGFECGYFYPVDCVYFNPRSASSESTQDYDVRGPVDDAKLSGEMIVTMPISEDDIWINALTDDRYVIQRIDNVEEWRSIPWLVRPTMTLLPPTSRIYTIDPPQRMAALLEFPVGGAGRP